METEPAAQVTCIRCGGPHLTRDCEALGCLSRSLQGCAILFFILGVVFLGVCGPDLLRSWSLRGLGEPNAPVHRQ